MFFVGASQPVVMLSLQVLRYALFPSESQPGNRVFVSDVYTAFVVVFVCKFVGSHCVRKSASHLRLRFFEQIRSSRISFCTRVFAASTRLTSSSAE